MVKDSKIDFLERRNRFLHQEYKTSLRQILSYLWEYRPLFIIILIMGIVQSALFMLVPLFFGPAMDVLVDPTRDISEVYSLFFVILGVQGFVAVLFGVRIYINRWMGANIIFNIRNDLS
jgi:ABC-type multidrug transport system fused ATPase/permease subunit